MERESLRITLIGDTHPEIIAIARELKKQNYSPSVFLSTYLTSSEYHFINKYRILPANIRLKLAIRVVNFPVKIRHRYGSLFEMFIKLISRLRFRKLQNVLTLFIALLNDAILSLYLAVKKPNIVICYDTVNLKIPKNTRLVTIALMAHPNEVRRALSEAALDFPSWKKTSGNLNRDTSRIYQKSDRIIVLSEYARNSFLAEGVPDEVIKVVNIGSNKMMTKAFSRQELNSNLKLNVLFVGQLNLRKGVPAILDAAKELGEKFQFVIVTPTDSIENQRINEFMIANPNLRFVIGPTLERLTKEYQEADVFIFPSYSEGFSLACIEALSWGLIPIISTNSGVNDALVGTKLEKFLIQPGSARDIVEKLNCVYEMSSEQILDAQYLAFEISKNYSLEKFAKVILDEIVIQ